ncbi:rna-directed dna polymerase from mobile element jockey- hypothetical protein [Limosa lapponica baueri]|uniref:Rna-directed dna polymerase from mobile element jockey-like n=1 Tax=Limosa lapponica baueri TaxID=1758121 RepID=A0A2I0UU94_LIMLA|nr:rna-directed dna polymerase from mobile element jockey- hypothetical protein [Limosa lapponica baueri]
MLLNIFINNLDDGIESTLTTFLDDTKLGAEVNMSGGRAILQRHLDWLEDWSSKNYIKFNKVKCKVLHLGQDNQNIQYWLGSVWLGSRVAERDLEVLVDNKLTSAPLQQQRQIRSWAASTGALLAERCDHPTLLSAFWAAPGGLCPVLASTIQERHEQNGEGPREDHKNNQRAEEPAL